MKVNEYNSEEIDETRSRLKLAAVRDLARAAFVGVLRRPCSEHDAAAGQPCWTLANDLPAVCGLRVHAWSNRRIESTRTTHGRTMK